MSHLKDLGIEASIKNIESAPIRFEATLHLPSSLKYFEGHFPENPVLPAFASIEISLALGRDLKVLPANIKKISNAKFLAVIKPQDTITVLVKNYDSSIDFEWQVIESGQAKKACEISVDI